MSAVGKKDAAKKTVEWDVNPIRFWVCLCVAILGFLGSVYFLRPGFMTVDSYNQFAEAKSQVYTDDHPPIMAFLWHCFLRVVPDQFGILLFHQWMMWTGLGILSYFLVKHLYLIPFFSLGIGFFPPILGLSGLIWKDTGLGASFLLGTSLLVWAQFRYSRVILGSSLLILFYGFAVRYNSLPAILPLLFWAAWLLSSHEASIIKKVLPLPLRKSRFRSSLLLCGGIGLSQLACIVLFVQFLAEGRHRYNEQSIFIFDLAGISVKTGKNEFPQSYLQLFKIFDLMTIKERFDPYDATALVFNDGVQYLTYDASIYRDLRNRWFQAIKEHPLIYLRNRFQMYSGFLGFGNGRKETYAYPLEFTASQLSPDSTLTRHERRFRWVVLNWILPAGESALFKLGTYLMLSLIFAGLVVFQSELNIAALCINLSGIFYLASYFWIVSASNFRYGWWAVFTTLLIPFFFQLKNDQPGN